MLKSFCNLFQPKNIIKAEQADVQFFSELNRIYNEREKVLSELALHEDVISSCITQNAYMLKLQSITSILFDLYDSDLLYNYIMPFCKNSLVIPHKNSNISQITKLNDTSSYYVIRSYNLIPITAEQFVTYIQSKEFAVKPKIENESAILSKINKIESEMNLYIQNLSKFNKLLTTVLMSNSLFLKEIETLALLSEYLNLPITTIKGELV